MSDNENNTKLTINAKVRGKKNSANKRDEDVVVKRCVEQVLDALTGLQNR